MYAVKGIVGGVYSKNQVYTGLYLPVRATSRRPRSTFGRILSRQLRLPELQVRCFDKPTVVQNHRGSLIHQ